MVTQDLTVGCLARTAAVVAFKLHPVVLCHCRTPLSITQTSLSQCETCSGRPAGQLQGCRTSRPLMVTQPFQSQSEHFSGRLVWRVQCRWGRGGLPLR